MQQAWMHQILLTSGFGIGLTTQHWEVSVAILSAVHDSVARKQESGGHSKGWHKYHYFTLLCYFTVLFYNSYSASHDNWCTETLWSRVITAQCEGMGEVGSARYEPALLPPCPSIRVLCYSNCQRSTQSHQQSKGIVCVLTSVLFPAFPYIDDAHLLHAQPITTTKHPKDVESNHNALFHPSICLQSKA